MSFVYAEKCLLNFDNETIKTLSIYSDTKVSTGENRSNWSSKYVKVLDQYGLIKTLILCPTCCISFAGNNILYVTKLLDCFAGKGEFSEELLCQKAFEIHKSAPKNDIEFLICYLCNGEQHIVCIKEGKMDLDCTHAWIGSQETFCELQKQRMSVLDNNPEEIQNATSNCFRKAIQETKDDSVGKHIFIHTVATSKSNRFIYQYRTESYLDISQFVLPGETIRISGDAAEGAFTVEYLDTTEDVIINIKQADLTILYTRRFRLDQFDTDNPNTRHFLLPIPCRSSTGKVLKI